MNKENEDNGSTKKRKVGGEVLCNVHDSDIVVSRFEFYSLPYVLFRNNSLGKGMIPLAIG